MADLISSTLDAGEFPGLIAQVQNINTLFIPHYRNLTAKERIGLRSMAEGREGYARLVCAIGSAHPDDLNRRDDPEALNARLDYDKNLELLRQHLLTALEKVTEIQMANATDIMTMVDSFVVALQSNRARNSALDNAMAEVDEYNSRFGRKPDSPDAPLEPGTGTDAIPAT